MLGAYRSDCSPEPFLRPEGQSRQLPCAGGLSNEEVEKRLKTMLVQLAIINVALDVCEHYTPRDCYRLLRDRLLHEAAAYPEMIGTGWTQHMCTFEYCERCAAEFDAEYENSRQDVDEEESDEDSD